MADSKFIMTNTPKTETATPRTPTTPHLIPDHLPPRHPLIYLEGDGRWWMEACGLRWTNECGACGAQEDSFTEVYRFCPHCGNELDFESVHPELDGRLRPEGQWDPWEKLWVPDWNNAA